MHVMCSTNNAFCRVLVVLLHHLLFEYFFKVVVAFWYCHGFGVFEVCVEQVRDAFYN